MVPNPHRSEQKRCEVCGVEIPTVRMAEVPGVMRCVKCQKLRELGRRSDVVQKGLVDPSSPGEEESVEVRGDQVVLGNWSGSLMELAGRGSQLIRLARMGDVSRARALVQALPVEEQAALVAMSEEPEEMLSMTGGDSSGGPGYSRQVVELLPTEILGNLISVNPDERKFNTELIRAMSPPAFRRAMAETLDRVDDSRLRTRVSWEWLQALATLTDVDHRTKLLRAVDPALLEDALLDRQTHLDLNAVVGFGGFQVYRFRLFSIEGLGGTRPSAFIDDPETGIVLDALYEASPALLSNIIRVAWERGRDDVQEQITGETRKQESAENGEQTNECSRTS